MSDQGGAIITIDGPAGVGKSTISKLLAAHLGYTYLDTGAMYRAVALYFHQAGIDLQDETAVADALARIVIDLRPATKDSEDVQVVLNGDNVSDAIRSPEMSMLASTVSAIPAVRVKLTTMQQIIGRQGAIVAEGRDTGTVVFPHAGNKFFLDAQPLMRARRRALQLRARGEIVDEQQLLEMTVARDRQDRERSVAPLKPAEDAVVIDTTDLSVKQVLDRITTLLGR